MTIIPKLTELETAQEYKKILVLESAEAVHHLATVLAQTNQKFWQIETSILLDVLNADMEQTLGTFAVNTQLGAAVNAVLDALDCKQFSTRAPLEPGRSDIGFNGKQFVLSEPVPEAPAEIAASLENPLEAKSEAQ